MIARKPHWGLWLKYLKHDRLSRYSWFALFKQLGQDCNILSKGELLRCHAALWQMFIFRVFNSGKFLVDKISCGQLTQMPLEMHWGVIVNCRQSKLNLLIIDLISSLNFIMAVWTRHAITSSSFGFLIETYCSSSQSMIMFKYLLILRRAGIMVEKGRSCQCVLHSIGSLVIIL